MSRTSRIFSKLFLIVLIIKIFDVFKNLVIASILGVSSNADIYTALISIPDSLIVILGLDTIRGVVNSEYAHFNTIGRQQEMWRSFNNLFNILFLIAIVVVAAIILFNNFIISILLPGFEGIKKEKAVEISYIIFPILFLKVFIGYFHSVYNAVKNFFFPVIAPVVVGIALLISVLIPYYNNEVIYNLSFANLAGNIVLFALMTGGLIKLGADFRIHRIEIDEVTQKVLKGSLSILLLVICNQLYLFSKNYFASYYGEGAISSLHYSGTIPSVIISIIFATFFTVLISDLSSIFSNEQKIKARKLFLNTLSSLIFMVIPVIVMFIVYAGEILSLVYLRGNFTEEGIQMTMKPFMWDALALFTFILYIIPTTLYLAKKEYLLLTKIGSLVYLTGILLNYLLTEYFGYYAISMAAFFTTGIYGIMLLFYSRKIIGRLGKYSLRIILMILSGVLTFVILVLLRTYFFDKYISNQFDKLLILIIINSLITILVYFAITYFLRVNYTSELLKSVKKQT